MQDLLEGGFKPLRKAYSEPVRGLMDCKDPRNEPKAPFLEMWREKDAWAPLRKKVRAGRGAKDGWSEAAAKVTSRLSV